MANNLGVASTPTIFIGGKEFNGGTMNDFTKMVEEAATMVNKPLLFAWITSIIAMVGSLFFSERMGFIPCTLCWYQRILMYPLVIFLGIAFYRNDREIYKYILPMSIIGIVVSSYHYALQKIPSMHEFSSVYKRGSMFRTIY